MSASYSGNPQSTPKDAVRFLCQDTGPTTFHFSDEEILYLLKTQANEFMTAALLCEKLTTIISGGGLASKSVGGLSESYSTGSIQFYVAQAARFRLIGSSHQCPVWDDQMVQRFSYRQFDTPGTRDPMVVDDRGTDNVLRQEDEL